MKKVGIITVHCADNFGAMLQTYALKKYLQNMDCFVEVINYCPKVITQVYPLLFYKGEIRAGIQSGLKCLWRSVIYIKIRNFPLMLCKKHKMRQFRKNYFNMTRRIRDNRDFKKLERFDYYITGSDQLWNPDITGLDDAYFLDFASEEGKKIAYAVSIGRLLNEEEREIIVEKTQDFDAVSLRETDSVLQLQPYSKNKIYQCVDPTLLLKKDEWEKICVKPIKEKYIMFYSLFYTKEAFEAVNDISERLLSPVKHFFYGRLAKRLKRNGGSFYYAGIEEFLGLIEQAEYVITDSFHGAVFSILFEKKFGVVLPPKRNMRLIELLNITGFSDRIISSGQTNFDWEWSECTKRYQELDLNKITGDSKDYLKRALGLKEI
ncbi:MAG: polysaccharide pyruvyl transferase family protein [Lachnospiraceae bacterium]|nr:polysaccharide pyruvyl transferase family protein [Lachnospiraceae bacterium]